MNKVLLTLALAISFANLAVANDPVSDNDANTDFAFNCEGDCEN